MKTMAALRSWARADRAVTEDVACKGTALESATFKLRGKAFLFVQPKAGSYIVRLKLQRSLSEASRRGYEVGANGWVKLTLASEDPPAVLAAWVDESRSIVAPPAARKAPARKTRS
jgi:hypothetical protein